MTIRHQTGLSFFTLCLLIAIGCARIAATYHVFNQTYDEPAHIACGMEWLDQGRYEMEPLHPPFARILMAIGPYLDGSRFPAGAPHRGGLADEYENGNLILYNNNYWRTLSLARIGILPFFALACVVVWAWTSHLFGKAAALVAVFLFTNLPPILGHAGLATTDMALTGTFAAAFYALTRYVENPSWPRAAFLGIAAGVSGVSKFSAIPFFVAGLAVLLAVRAWRQKHGGEHCPRIPWRQCVVCAAIVMLVSWSVYRFRWAPVIDPLDLPLRPGAGLHNSIVRLLAMPWPGGLFLRGLKDLYLWNRDSRGAYLLGATQPAARWYFFPVVIAVKTPLAFLFLSGIGAVLLGRRSRPGGNQTYQFVPLLAAGAMLLIAMCSNMNMGVRHVLIVYPLLAMVAGYGVMECYRRGRVLRLTAIALTAWLVASSALAHPDYMAYFNELAGSRPERIVVDSDLDWGQDLHRLSLRLKALDARSLAIWYFGTARLDRAGLPPFQPLVSCRQPVDWAAVSTWVLAEREERDNPERAALYSCLSSLEPVERIGKSILLYRFEKAEAQTRH